MTVDDERLTMDDVRELEGASIRVHFDPKHHRAVVQIQSYSSDLRDWLYDLEDQGEVFGFRHSGRYYEGITKSVLEVLSMPSQTKTLLVSSCVRGPLTPDRSRLDLSERGHPPLAF